jgi:hypothetical protein
MLSFMSCQDGHIAVTGRRLGQETIIRVQRWPGAQMNWYVTSSRCSGVMQETWNESDRLAIAQRLGSGRDKGRVLYLLDRGYQAGEVAQAAALLHLARGRFEVTQICYRAGMPESSQALARTLLLRCAFTATSEFGRPVLDWLMPNRQTREMLAYHPEFEPIGVDHGIRRLRRSG